jgi:hypothetical protein
MLNLFLKQGVSRSIMMPIYGRTGMTHKVQRIQCTTRKSIQKGLCGRAVRDRGMRSRVRGRDTLRSNET